MYKNADKLQEQLKKENGVTDVSLKLDNDPRIIKGLNFIRTYSIDELMQLLNVLKGDMSIIGPRPLPIYEYEEVKAIADGDAEKIGELMKEAQNIFDAKVAPGCPSELTAPKLHSVLNDEKIAEFAFGGKGVGSQGDGTIQFIAKDKENQQKLVEYLDSIGLDSRKSMVRWKY